MKKLFIFILFTVFSLSGEGVKISDFEYGQTEKKIEKSKDIVCNNENTVNLHYFTKKFNKQNKDELFKSLSKNIAFSYGNGKKDYFIFIDPECKFSRAFAKDSLEHLSEATYHIILMPLKKHKNSNNMISFILQGKTEQEKFLRFKSVFIDEKFNPSFVKIKNKQSEEYVKNVLRLSKEYGVKSVPSFVKIDISSLKQISWANYNEELEFDSNVRF